MTYTTSCDLPPESLPPCKGIDEELTLTYKNTLRKGLFLEVRVDDSAIVTANCKCDDYNLGIGVPEP